MIGLPVYDDNFIFNDILTDICLIIVDKLPTQYFVSTGYRETGRRGTKTQEIHSPHFY